MDLLVLDASFNGVRILDSYKSLIWTERYREAGDFELVTDISALSYIQKGYYLYNANSESLMIAENFEIDTDVETGNYLTVSGRSLESILDRRIIWTQTNLDGHLPGQIQRLLNENAINPTDTSRMIPNMIFRTVTDTRITGLSIQAQYTGDNLYDTIVAICEEQDIGWKLILNSSNQLEFVLYKGIDRSYEQSAVPFVIFSPEFDNIINSNYIESDKTLKNVALVAGEGEGTERRTVSIGTETGLARRELYVDARDISSTTDSETTMTEEEYNALLTQRGNEKLAENQSTKSFEGEIDYKRMFAYGEHYFLGDICEMENEYGIGCRIMVSEVVISVDESGQSIYPTFCSV